MGINPSHLYRLLTQPTEAELAIEPAVAALGYPYRCQWPFVHMSLVADFCFPTLKVVLEVDGPSHARPAQKAKDLLHTQALEAEGWRVLRCSNADALTNPHETVRRLFAGLSPVAGMDELERRPTPARARRNQSSRSRSR